MIFPAHKFSVCLENRFTRTRTWVIIYNASDHQEQDQIENSAIPGGKSCLRSDWYPFTFKSVDSRRFKSVNIQHHIIYSYCNITVTQQSWPILYNIVTLRVLSGLDLLLRNEVYEAIIQNVVYSGNGPC
jgi:hypothetical protein